MTKIFILLSILFLFSCSNNKVVYWCGDHACVNKKEKDAYFKKNMIIEVKNIENKKKGKNSKNEEIIKQVKNEQKKLAKKDKELAKKNKLEKKIKLKKEKELAKQIKLEEKRILKEEKKRIKEEKKLARKMEKQIKKDSKITEDSNEKNEKITSLNNNEIEKSGFPNIFHRIKESIVGKNLNKPYPDINDIPK
tara:strand:- start:34 stop:612 length:579 start_codon:yes stop_codon:yes gene_type:complete